MLFGVNRAFSLWQKPLLFGISFYLCALVGSNLSAGGGSFVTFWLPAGLYLSVFLIAEFRNWPIFACAALLANFTFDLPHGTKPLLICCFFVINTLQAATGAWLIRRFVAKPMSLTSLKEYVALLFFSAIFAAAFFAAVGSGALMAFGFSQSFLRSWETWWGSNGMAILLLTPFIIAWFGNSEKSDKPIFSIKKGIEITALSVVLVFYIWFLLDGKQGVLSPIKTAGVPILLWAGIRFGVRGATTISLLLALTLSYFTTQHGLGITPEQFKSNEYIFALQVSLTLGSLVALIPAIVVGERNKMLTELSESEERFKNLSAAAFEGIAISKNGILLDVNDQFLAMFGFKKREEVIGKAIVDLIAPEHKEMVTTAIKEGREHIYGHKLVRLDGSLFEGEAQVRTVHSKGELVQMTALRDITDRKRAEQELQENQRMLATLLSNLPGMAYRCQNNLDWRMEFVSEGCRELTGYSPEDFIGKKISYGQITHGEDNVSVWNSIQAALHERRQFELTYRIRTAGGVEKWVLERGRGIFSDKGELISIEGFISDITERKRTEESLEKSEALFRSYFELALVGCVISSLDKGIFAVNDEFCRMLGYSREELLKMTWVQLTHADDIALDVEHYNRVLSGEIDSYVIDKRYLHKSGRIVFVTLAVRCIRHQDASPDYFVGLAMDITERHQSILREQQTRAEYTRQLIESQEAERTRIARELHDSLGQNLSLIKNYAQLEMTRAQLAHNVKDGFQNISDLASRAIAEVRQISHDLHPPQLDILGLTRALKALVESTQESSPINITSKIDPTDNLFPLEVATNIYRVVQECLNNIQKHSKAKNAHVTLEQDIHEVVLKIEDDGCGFMVGNIAKGLGLKNIAERVQMIGARMKLDSRPEKGTTLEITIPISK